MYDFSNSKRGETLVSILVGVVILSIAMGGVVMILIQSRTIEEDYNKNNTLSILQSNAENIVRKTDTSDILEKEIFFLHKDSIEKTFRVFTGTANEWYKYIDGTGDFVANPGAYEWTVYTRVFTVERWDTSLGELRQIIKGGIKELIRK